MIPAEVDTVDATVSIPEGEKFTSIFLTNRYKGTILDSRLPGDVSEYNLVAALSGVKHASLTIGVDNSAETSHKTFTVLLDSETPDDLGLEALAVRALTNSGWATMMPTPAFASDVTEYSFTAPFDTTQIRVEADKTDHANTYFTGKTSHGMRWMIYNRDSTISAGQSMGTSDSASLQASVPNLNTSTMARVVITFKVVGIDSERTYTLNVTLET